VNRPPIEVYEAGLRAAGRGHAAGWRLRYADGTAAALPLSCWTGTARPGDAGLIDRCAGPTIDVGCGPGRLTALLAARGVPALGIDLAPYAVALARRRGGTALHRDLFGPLPGEGRWHRLLLADGNVGIGGDPAALLLRCARLLHPAGALLCETDAPDRGLRRLRVRLEPPDGAPSAWFRWAQVGMDALPELAAPAGLAFAGTWAERGRWFAVLTPARSGAAANAARPAAKPTRADQPSSSRARADDAVTCRTSPSR
jgi:SAM-dependent methyltransferase